MNAYHHTCVYVSAVKARTHLRDSSNARPHFLQPQCQQIHPVHQNGALHVINVARHVIKVACCPAGATVPVVWTAGWCREIRPVARSGAGAGAAGTLKGSTMRNSATMSELLPLPVRPQMPIFSPAAMSKETPFSTAGSSGRYRIHTSRYDTAPSVGQLSAGLRPGPFPASDMDDAVRRVCRAAVNNICRTHKYV